MINTPQKSRFTRTGWSDNALHFPGLYFQINTLEYLKPTKPFAYPFGLYHGGHRTAPPLVKRKLNIRAAQVVPCGGVVDVEPRANRRSICIWIIVNTDVHTK